MSYTSYCRWCGKAPAYPSRFGKKAACKVHCGMEDRLPTVKRILLAAKVPAWNLDLHDLSKDDLSQLVKESILNGT